MKGKKRIGVKVLQTFAIIFLVIALLSTGLYFLLSTSLSKADKNQAVPEIFGKMYVPITSETFESIASNSKGSFIMLDSISGQSVAANDVVVYDTPTTATDNTVYGNYSLGRVVAVSTENGTVLTMLSVKSNETFDIPVELVKAKATWQIDHMGTLATLAKTNMGLIWLVILPFFIFIVFQLVTLIVRILGGRSDDEDDDEYYEEYEEEREETPRPIVRQTRSPARRFDTGYLEKEPLEQMNLNFEKKANVKPTQIKSQTVSTIVDGEYAEPVEKPAFRPGTAPLFDPKPAAAQPKPEAPKAQPLVLDTPQRATPKFDPAEDILKQPSRDRARKLDENSLLAAALLDESDYSDVSAQVDEFLKSLTVGKEHPEAAALEQEIMNHTTLEFDMDAIRQRLLKEELLKDDDERDFVKMPESQDLLDKIMIELKDTAVDFRFQNVESNDVKISANNTGDGFSIKTPKYKANIKVEIDKE